MSSTEIDIYRVRVSEDLSSPIVTKISDLLLKKGLVTKKAPSLVSYKELVNSEVPLKTESNLLLDISDVRYFELEFLSGLQSRKKGTKFFKAQN